jgi:capsular polysaccharide biosynthesis protein
MSMQEFIQYVRIVRKRWWLLVAICGVTLATLVVLAQLRPVTYEASVRFLVNVPPSSDVTLYPGFDRPSASQQVAATTATFMEVLRSPTVLQRTREALQLAMSLSALEQAVFVEKPVDSEFVWVTVMAPQPDEAAAIANTLVEEARNYYGEIQAAPSAAAREFIAAQARAAAEEIARVQSALGAFKLKNNIGDLEAEIDVERTILWNLALSQGEAIARGATSEAQVYDRLIAERQANLTRLTGLSEEYAALQSELKRLQGYYLFLSDKETEARLKENEILRASFIQVVAPATPPSQPRSPYDPRLMIVGLVVSLVVGIVMAFVLEYLEGQRRELIPASALNVSSSQATD